MALKQTTAPALLPVSLSEAKDHLRVDVSDEDAYITLLVEVAAESAEHMTGRALMPQAWTLTLDAFPAVLELTRIPVASVTSIKYDDINGVEQTLAPSEYTLKNADDFDIATVVPAFGKTWPATIAQANAVRVVYAAGYPDAASVPESIKAWMKLLIGSIYANRESERIERGNMLTLGFADRLLDRFRIYKL